MFARLPMLLVREGADTRDSVSMSTPASLQGSFSLEVTGPRFESDRVVCLYSIYRKVLTHTE